MNEIGDTLRIEREKIGVSLEEASKDLNIKELILKNIEDGNIGCFKDVFVLKDYIKSYAKYLGIPQDSIINEFNEYLFEYTSRIPVEDIEKAIALKEKEKVVENAVASPYTKKSMIKNKKVIVFTVICSIILLFILIWSLKQIIISNSNVANSIYYKEENNYEFTK